MQMTKWSGLMSRVRAAKPQAASRSPVVVPPWDQTSLAPWNQAGNTVQNQEFDQETAATMHLVNIFIKDNLLDEAAATMLRNESADVQIAVMERGTLMKMRNPSSALIGRVRDAKPQCVHISSNTRQPCPLFELGGCIAGSACEYSHITAGGVAPNTEPEAAVREGDGVGRKRKQCKFFDAGICAKGDACGYLHNITENMVQLASDSSSNKKRKLCVLWEMGGCTKGSACEDAHFIEKTGPRSERPDTTVEAGRPGGEWNELARRYEGVFGDETKAPAPLKIKLPDSAYTKW